jgi:hypothetical protein
MLAAASLGDHDTANKCLEQYREIVFPETARSREDYLQSSVEILKSLRGVGFKVQEADWKLDSLSSKNSAIFGKNNG